jgi:hypothetical protein
MDKNFFDQFIKIYDIIIMAPVLIPFATRNRTKTKAVSSERNAKLSFISKEARAVLSAQPILTSGLSAGLGRWRGERRL